MKRLILSFVAVVGLLATSCVQDATDDLNVGKPGVVTFAVEAPQLSRAYGDTYGGATEATQLYYAVYRDQELLEAISATNEPVLLTDGKASIELSLASGLEYEFVFWAASEAAIQDELYTIDWRTKAMTLNPAKLVTSDESLDAFYKYEKHTISSSNTYEVILKRPFAQINVATNDTAAAAAAGLVVAESWFEVSGAFTTLNLETGYADNVGTLNYKVAAKPEAGNTVEANGVNYDLLGVIYVLANAEQSSLNNVKFQYNRAEGGEAVKTIEVPMTPIKRNARTNLVGKILTSDNNFEIEVDPNWGDSFEVDPSAYTTVAVDAASNEEAVVVYTDPTDATAPKKVIINNVAGLDWFAAQGKARTTEAVDASYKVVEQLNTNGGTFEGMVVELNADIDLANVNWTPIANFLGVFDGNNYTVSNVKIVVENNDPAGFFARAKYVQNLKLQNVSINAHYKAGAVVGDGLCSRIENCHVDGLTLEVTPDENKDNANHVGGIVGYLSAENEAYVKGCSVKNATIVAYRDVAAVVGTANQKSEVVGNTAENVDVVANMLPEYAEQGKNANAGEIAGRVHEAATVENNTVTNVKVDVLKWENDTLSLGSAAAFTIVGKYVSEGDDCEGKTIKLTSDVDLFKGYMPDGDPVTTAPIGNKGTGGKEWVAFKGTFDGQNHAVKNLYQNGWTLKYEWGVYGSIGLFSELENATVKNLTVEAMDALIEGGDISFIAGSATGTCVFENITIKSSSIGTYNNGCGGIIGWSGAGNYTFKNIVLESDVVLGGLWGSFDSSIGGVVGQAEPGATYNFENVTINCRIDAYNDCTASYDYYNYRMCGMIIGRCEETTTIDGKNYPDLSKYNMTFNNVVVNYGDWMNYHYCRKSGERAVRVEPGYAYGGVAADRDHSTDNVHCMECIPFNQLIGGDQYAVKGLPAVDGVVVNYPASFVGSVATVEDLNKAKELGIQQVVLSNDLDCGTTQLALDGISVDLNGKTLTTEMTHGGMSLKNGASIKNGTIEHKTTVAAIKAFNAGSIENVTIKCTCATEGKTITGIAVQQYGHVGAIKNVTVEGVSQGIEVGYQATVDLIENAQVNMSTNGTANGIGLVINGGKVGLAKDSTFKGSVYGATMHLKGVFAVGLELQNCVVEGATASIYACDEKGLSNTSGSLVLTYDAATTLKGDLVWDFEEECQGVVTLNKPM